MVIFLMTPFSVYFLLRPVRFQFRDALFQKIIQPEAVKYSDCYS